MLLPARPAAWSSADAAALWSKASMLLADRRAAALSPRPAKLAFSRSTELPVSLLRPLESEEAVSGQRVLDASMPERWLAASPASVASSQADAPVA